MIFFIINILITNKESMNWILQKKKKKKNIWKIQTQRKSPITISNFDQIYLETTTDDFFRYKDVSQFANL